MNCLYCFFKNTFLKMGDFVLGGCFSIEYFYDFLDFKYCIVYLLNVFSYLGFLEEVF